MFGSKNNDIMAKSTELDSSAINIIGNGTSIVGELVANGDLRVDGNFNGKINTKGKIVVGPTGVITGEVICRNADISGKIEGKILVQELLSLKSSARIIGDIITNKLAIEPNAVFTGGCNMGSENVESKAKQTQQPVEKH